MAPQGPAHTWNQVEEIFLAAADLPSDQQPAFLDQACGANAALRCEVDALLHADSRSESFLHKTIGGELDALLEDDSVAGSRLGAYRVIREIGRGGMGAVYLAERDDDQYHMKAAIKVVKRGMDTTDVLSRFRHERQILANLDHPYIARLIDGGTTPDGRPFFVMEYVEGEPVDAWCRNHNLDIDARLHLFLRVCEAVSHAHQSLVVHRDLKPANILVTAAGIPKLLDFGVAKLLAPGIDPGLTSALRMIGPITPEYASPEQVQGLPVTTATDVYSLGTVLYELLTGARAQSFDSRTPDEIERVVCETDARRPSVAARSTAAARRLRGDLDNIVLMAMRKERERRYQSVDQLAEDIRRHLGARPVMARQSSVAYRAGKYLRRHRLGILAAVLIFTSLVAGVAVAVSQARGAHAARRVAEAQSETADRERARAEAETDIARLAQERSRRRLTQMVEMANRTLNEVHSSIERLPGATEARRQMVAATLKLLEGLQQDGASDQQLVLVLSNAYLKVGDVQGFPLRPNLGDSAGALANYEKAARLVEPLLAAEPDNPYYLQSHVNARTRAAILLDWMGERPRALAIAQASLPAARKLARLRPHDLEARQPEADLYGTLATHYRNYDIQQGLRYAHLQAAAFGALARDFPDDTQVKIDLAAAYSQEAGEYLGLGDGRQAIARYRDSIALREALARASPGDVVVRRGLMISYANLGGALGSPLQYNQGDTAGAREYYGKALGIARDLARVDASDQLAQYDLANALLYYASLDTPPVQAAESHEMLRESAAILGKLLAAKPKTHTACTKALAEEMMAKRLRQMGRPAEALAAYRRSLATIQPYLESNPADLQLLAQELPVREAIAEELARQGDSASALETAHKALTRAQQISAPASERSRITGYVAVAQRTIGTVEATLGHCAEAQQAARQSLVLWREVEASGSKRIRRDEVERAEALVRECKAR